MKYYCDGFQIGGNPSDIGGGYSIVDENNKLVECKNIHREHFTNNEAEILGIWGALLLANTGDTISTDSMCCLSWVNKGKSKARPDLKSVLARCKELKEEKQINLMWEAREFNLAGKYNEFERPLL